MDNRTLSKKLIEHGEALEQNGHGLYRVRAYRRAAAMLAMLPCEVDALFRKGGREALEALPGIGPHLAYTLEKLLREGEMDSLGPRPDETDPRERLQTLPGIGTRTMERFRNLGVRSVEDVDEGNLDRAGVKGKRRRAVLTGVAERRAAKRVVPACEPSVAELLDLDEQFRALSCDGLRPGSPVLLLERDGWTFRVSFSNSPLAHRLGQARDWVVIRFENGTCKGERIVVSETRPPRPGTRVVRGREHECLAGWAS